MQRAVDVPYVGSGRTDVSSELATKEARCPRSEGTDEELINTVTEHATDSKVEAAQLNQK